MGATVTWYAVTSSTNDRAKEGAASGAPHGAVYVAEAQSAGRGRLGRVWQSPAGAGLYCSVILDVPARVVPFVTLTAGVAAAEIRAGRGDDGRAPTSASTVVPAPGPLRTRSSPPTERTRSRMLRSPNALPASPARRPRPSSATRRHQ